MSRLLAQRLLPSIIFFFNDTATTEIYTLSLHDALPIYDDQDRRARRAHPPRAFDREACRRAGGELKPERSEEHTSELQSRSDLVCRLLLEKKKSEHFGLRPLQILRRKRLEREECDFQFP